MSAYVSSFATSLLYIGSQISSPYGFFGFGGTSAYMTDAMCRTINVIDRFDWTGIMNSQFCSKAGSISNATTNAAISSANAAAAAAKIAEQVFSLHTNTVGIGLIIGAVGLYTTKKILDFANEWNKKHHECAELKAEVNKKNAEAGKTEAETTKINEEVKQLQLDYEIKKFNFELKKAKLNKKISNLL